jgi:hypothetical protein
MEAQNDSGDFDLLDQELLQFFDEDFEFETFYATHANS